MAAAYFFLMALRKKRNKKAMLNKLGNIVAEKCRVCLKEGYIPIFGALNSDLPFAIQTFGEINLSEDDPYPKHLCESCNSLLNAAILFRKSAKQSQEILLSAEVENNENYEIDSTSLQSDQNSVNVQQTYNCTICKIPFNSIEELNIHKSTKKHKKVRIQCSVCQRLVTSNLYKRHLQRHKTASHLICEICGKMSRKDNLFRHLQLHSFELPYKCQQCPYRGRFMESLKIHMRTHSGEKPFACDKCDLRFITRSNLNRHLLTHKKEKPHKCIECSRGFYNKRDMEIHYKSDHAGIKDFSCQTCGNKYGTRKAIMRHELRVHKRDKMAKGRMPLYLQEEFKKSN